MKKIYKVTLTAEECIERTQLVLARFHTFYTTVYADFKDYHALFGD